MLFFVGFAGITVRHLRQEDRDQRLLIAIGSQDPTVLRLLAEGADPNAREDRTLLPSTGMLGRIRSVLGFGMEKRKQGTSALTQAVLNNDTPIVQALLKAGARDVNARLGTEDYTPPVSSATLLMTAAGNKNAEIVSALLDRGADHRARNTFGQTALFYAIDSEACLRLLIAHGADVDAHDDYGDTLLIWAASSNTHSLPAVLRCLPSTVNVNARNLVGVSALVAAGTQGNPENVRLLLERGADPTVYNNAGHTRMSALNSLLGEPGFPSKMKLPRNPEILRLLKRYGASK